MHGFAAKQPAHLFTQMGGDGDATTCKCPSGQAVGVEIDRCCLFLTEGHTEFLSDGGWLVPLGLIDSRNVNKCLVTSGSINAQPRYPHQGEPYSRCFNS